MAWPSRPRRQPTRSGVPSVSDEWTFSSASSLWGPCWTRLNGFFCFQPSGDETSASLLRLHALALLDLPEPVEQLAPLHHVMRLGERLRLGGPSGQYRVHQGAMLIADFPGIVDQRVRARHVAADLMLENAVLLGETAVTGKRHDRLVEREIGLDRRPDLSQLSRGHETPEAGGQFGGAR